MSQMKSLSNSQKYLLIDMIAPTLDDYLQSMDVTVHRSGKKFVGACPVHGGDNHTAFNIFPDGYSTKCNWTCFTHKCQNKYGSNLIGLTQGIKKCTNEAAIQTMLDYLGLTSADLKSDSAMEAKLEYIKQAQLMTKQSMQAKGVLRSKMLEHLAVPADYFLKRGISSEILTKYDVGMCISDKYPHRAIVPIYDDSGTIMVGFSARTTRPKCPTCEKHHFVTESCPESNKTAHVKWITQENFNLHSYLYNYWNAKQYILKYNYIILVEGPGDVWKFEECGQHNSLAIFGTNLTDEQMIILEKSGAFIIYLALDNDDAGRQGARAIEKQCSRIFNVVSLKYDAADIGSASNKEIKKMLIGVT